MNKEIIKNLGNDLLLELYKNVSSNLKYQRKYWIDNKFDRTNHLNKLINDTREELEFVIDIIKNKKETRCKLKEMEFFEK